MLYQQLQIQNQKSYKAEEGELHNRRESQDNRNTTLVSSAGSFEEKSPSRKLSKTAQGSVVKKPIDLDSPTAWKSDALHRRCHNHHQKIRDQTYHNRSPNNRNNKNFPKQENLKTLTLQYSAKFSYSPYRQQGVQPSQGLVLPTEGRDGFAAQPLVDRAFFGSLFHYLRRFILLMLSGTFFKWNSFFSQIFFKLKKKKNLSFYRKNKILYLY